MSNQQHPYPEIQLKDVLRVLDKTIKEDNTNKAIIFLGMLSAFTEESQLNITLNAPSSAGKTYLVKEIVKLFPKADCIQFSNATPTAIFYGEDAKNDKERKARIVDLERKILIFMEQPDSKAQEKIRAVLSHDQKECIYNITNRNKEGANRAEKVIIRGYPASIFCSANLSLDEQESTRAIMLSPEMTATKILLMLNEMFLDSNKDYTYTVKYENQNLVKALNFINENYHKELTLEIIAKNIFISQNELCSIFKKHLGTTVKKYITSRRITKAKLLLKKGKTVSETAALCGFEDYSSFIRAFGRVTGMSPGKYKKTDIS